MKRKNSYIGAVSLGIAIILIHAFLFTQASSLYPTNPGEYQIRVGIYAVLLALVFAFGITRTEKSLVSTGFFSKEGIVKFFLAAVISLVVLLGFGLTLQGTGLRAVADGLSSIGIGILLLHAFIVAYDEELIFRGFLPDRLTERGLSARKANIFQAVVFALFHWGITGGSFVLMIPYVILGLVFFEIKVRFSPRTQSANAGAHFAWNTFILGFVQRFSI